MELKLRPRLLNALEEQGLFIVGDLFRIQISKLKVVSRPRGELEPQDWWMMSWSGKFYWESYEYAEE